MELRLIVAYSLMALLAAFAAGLVVWLRYNSRDRAVERSRRRVREASERRRAAGEAGEG